MMFGRPCLVPATQMLRGIVAGELREMPRAAAAPQTQRRDALAVYSGELRHPFLKCSTS